MYRLTCPMFRIGDGVDALWFDTMGEACRYATSEGEQAATSYTLYDTGGGTVTQGYQLGDRCVSIRTRWSDHELRLYGDDAAGMTNATSYVVADRSDGTAWSSEIKGMFRRELMRWTTLGEAGVRLVANLDVDWLSDEDAIVRRIGDDVMLDLCGGGDMRPEVFDFLDAAWDHTERGVHRAVRVIRSVVSGAETSRGGYSERVRDVL